MTASEIKCISHYMEGYEATKMSGWDENTNVMVKRLFSDFVTYHIVLFARNNCCNQFDLLAIQVS